MQQELSTLMRITQQRRNGLSLQFSLCNIPDADHVDHRTTLERTQHGVLSTNTIIFIALARSMLLAN